MINKDISFNTNVNYLAIPDILRAKEQWVVWGSRREAEVNQVDEEGRLIKIPFTAASKTPASTTKPASWTTFELAAAECRGGWFNGVGYVLFKDDVTCIDLDHCISLDKTGKAVFTYYALDILSTFNAFSNSDVYVEYGPSNDGIHIWCLGNSPTVGSRFVHPIEVYGTNAQGQRSPRFMSVTGQTVYSSYWTPGIMTDKTNELDWLTSMYGLPENATAPKGRWQETESALPKPQAPLPPVDWNAKTHDEKDEFYKYMQKESMPPDNEAGLESSTQTDYQAEASSETEDEDDMPKPGDKSQYVDSIINGDSAILRKTPYGERNVALFKIACSWKRLSNAPWADITWNEAANKLEAVARESLPKKEVQKTIRQGGKTAGLEERKPPKNRSGY